jgi:Zn-dependent M28 family amino/carboxypeptidase
VLGAHYDSVPGSPGANDNASGVAALLEAIEAFQKGGPAKRTLCFVAFDLEERGLIGSQHFADHPPFPLEDLALFITCDMLGRSLGDIVNDAVFVLGTEHAPELRALVEGQETETEGRLKAGFLGTDLIGTRSDYGPFRARGVPYLFFSTGEHRDYHKPTDVPDRIEYGKLTKIARLLYRVTRAAADAPERPVFVKQPEPDLREVKLVSRILGTVAAHSGKLGLSEMDHAALTELRGRVDAIVASGKVTAAQRQSLKEAAQLLLFRLIR